MPVARRGTRPRQRDGGWGCCYARRMSNPGSRGGARVACAAAAGGSDAGAARGSPTHVRTSVAR
jgi:hypothetical protein